MYVRISDKIQSDKSIIRNQSSIMYLVKSTAVSSIICRNNNCNLKYHFLSYKSLANEYMTNHVICWKETK